MPLVILYSNVEPESTALEGILSKATKITARELGKPESIVMARTSFGDPMMLNGTTEPALLVEIEGLGTDDSATGTLTNAFCDFGKDELGVDPARTFVKLHNVPRGRWGNGYKVF